MHYATKRKKQPYILLLCTNYVLCSTKVNEGKRIRNNNTRIYANITGRVDTEKVGGAGSVLRI